MASLSFGEGMRVRSNIFWPHPPSPSPKGKERCHISLINFLLFHFNIESLFCTYQLLRVTPAFSNNRGLSADGFPLRGKSEGGPDLFFNLHLHSSLRLQRLLIILRKYFHEILQLVIQIFQNKFRNCTSCIFIMLL